MIQQVYQLKETILLDEKALEPDIIVIIPVQSGKQDTGRVRHGNPKYIKGKKVDKYNPELVKFLANCLQCGKTDAEEFIGILLPTVSGRDNLIKLLKTYGHTDKEIKKLLK